MQNVKRTGREISRLVLTIIMACMMAVLLASCTTHEHPTPPEQEMGHEHHQDVENTVKALVGPVIETLAQETSAAIQGNRQAIAALRDELAGIAGIIDARVEEVMGLRSDDNRCRADARFNVRHDGQWAFRDEVRNLMSPTLPQSQTDADVYERQDMARDEFYGIVEAIEMAAVKHGLPLESLTTSKFPPCSIREVRSEHVPVFGTGEAASLLEPNCDVDISMTISLRGLPPETDYWLYDAEDRGLQTRNEPLKYSEHLKDVPCGNEVNGVVETYAMLLREAQSREFQSEIIHVRSYMKITASYRGVAGGAVATGPQEYEEIQLGELPEAVRSLFMEQLQGG